MGRGAEGECVRSKPVAISMSPSTHCVIATSASTCSLSVSRISEEVWSKV